jgi:uroporphyrinogen-III synthase
MSPSAVYSFQENAAFMHQICFAIGKSTAQALKDLGQDCIISKQTHAKSIVDAARQYFNR